MLAVPALLLAGTVAVQGLDIGLRLVLPSLALLFVAAAPVARHLRGRVGALVVGALVLSQVAVLVAAGPHSLAWTPPPFTPSYRYVSDSNVDFGQDLWRLRDWTAASSRGWRSCGPGASNHPRAAAGSSTPTRQRCGAGPRSA